MVRDSAFNLAIGPLVKLWRIGFHGHSVPDAADIRARLALTRPQEVILDEATCSVFLQQPGMELDLGRSPKVISLTACAIISVSSRWRRR